ncbi:periplasmic-binding protein/LacI transcriptional regulator [Vibrio nigripulchritudo ATCC 27043]|uniref:Autoinducer 2-binding periplasmic protein LuxP n=2 Tax=Vibrio nigripulchritudo TaxID=28173 RepID=U4KFY5_9VIBR|nr:MULTISPECIES: sugar ABC transporter substrate-binding protein [Vibrio]EGU50542.1 periplasmic-binding protein/LacI transcriptional regulator [Vibrio nigripulchritudo ATCC 27043]UAB69155.1 sugar ABC transporter substrate-binding protein [Vibrio sp. SCSIO 43132]CCO58233.1 putative ABC-type sugar transport system, periplasmic component [Vibrio nigripulchritudo]BCL69291.1 sugar ABC transporter substrate-binding protein [Vibrio nigripulchritudo]BDU30625.1 sugar ABC transporter substrate-binding p
MNNLLSNIAKKASVLALALCSTAIAFLPSTASAEERFVLVSHAPDADSWWNTIKTAIKEAGQNMDVSVEYRNPPTGDLADMARIIEQAVASNPQGIITTLADYDVLKGPLEKAKKKGIPVVTINSGTKEQSEKVGALLHVGQPEYDAGFGAGKRAKADGIKNFLCVNHYITNPASVERCQGFADALGVDLGGQMIDSGQDPTGIEKKVLAFLRKNPNTEAILTLGPTSAHPTLRALEKNRQLGKIYFGSFDLSNEIAQGIKDGNIKWAIDQQPYLQGYLPVMVLTLFNRYGVMPSNHINSGPGFVTLDNLALVEKLAGEYR